MGEPSLHSLRPSLKFIIPSVFVHRYRDLDPNIRAECVRAIGFWFRKYPGHFLDTSYLRYVSWVLSDSHTLVRVESVKALAGIYNQSHYIVSLSHFTERFKLHLVLMAKPQKAFTTCWLGEAHIWEAGEYWRSWRTSGFRISSDFKLSMLHLVTSSMN